MTTGLNVNQTKIRGPSSARPPKTKRGATLLELIFVMAIICTVLAMAAPSLRGFFASRRTSDAASQMLALMKLARSRAIAEGRVYRFNLDTEAGTYWLTAREGGVFVDLQTETGREFALPQDTVAQWNGEMERDEFDYIQFYPDGSADLASIRLIGRQGEVLDLCCPSASEFFEIKNPYQNGKL